MGRKAIDRTGEEKVNKFGSKMVIREYRGALDMDVYFPEYNWSFKHAQYQNFKNRNIKCPYEPRIYGYGYLGEGKYKVWKMVKLQTSMMYGAVCYKDVMILNIKKNILHTKDVV